MAARIYKCLFAMSFSSLLSLPLDILSTENVVHDGMCGFVIVISTLCFFIAIVWLREQIVHGGAPEWLEPPLPPRRAAENRAGGAAAEGQEFYLYTDEEEEEVDEEDDEEANENRRMVEINGVDIAAEQAAGEQGRGERVAGEAPAGAQPPRRRREVTGEEDYFIFLNFGRSDNIH